MVYEVGEYKLQDGKVAVITHVQPQAKKMYVGYIRMPSGELKACDWDDRGRWATAELAIIGFDLPGARHKRKISGYVNIYKIDGCDDVEISPIHATLDDAKAFGSDCAIARVRVELSFDEGENL